MLKIRRAANGEVVFTVIGRMDTENIAELEALLKPEKNSGRIVLDLKDLTLADQDAVKFLERCEGENITLRNCPAYIREWIMSRKSTVTKAVRARRRNADKQKE